MNHLYIKCKVDLRSSSCMAPVKYQGGCGSCYTFATVNPIEYQHCMKTGTLVILRYDCGSVIDFSKDRTLKFLSCPLFLVKKTLSIAVNSTAMQDAMEVRFFVEYTISNICKA